MDAQGYPHLAYRVEDISGKIYGLAYGVCTAGCETTSPTWAHELVESPHDLEASDPIAPQPGCQSVWLYDGLNPSLALQGTAPCIAYGASHSQGGACSVHTDVELVRFALGGSGGPAPIGHPAVWLPMLKR
jgi:hypothetical protein